MRSMWQGALKLSELVAPEVTVCLAEQPMEGAASVALKEVCSCHNEPLSRSSGGGGGGGTFCRVTGKRRRTQAMAKAGQIKDTIEMVKAFPEDDGTFTPIPPAALDKIQAELEDLDGKTITPVAYVPYGEAPMEQAIGMYYVRAEPKSRKALGALHAALLASGSVLLAKWLGRGREHFVAIHPVGEALVLNRMLYPQEVAPPDEKCVEHYEFAVNASEKIVAGLGALLGALPDAIPEDLTDGAIALKAEAIERARALAHGKKPRKAAPVEPEPVAMDDDDDLEQLLEASLAATSGGGTSAKPKPKPKTRKKVSA